MITMLSISLFFIGGATIYFNMLQFEKKQNDIIREKVQSVLNELENNLGEEQELNTNWHNNKLNNLDELLGMLSNVFYTDINLYDLKGKLLATSRSEVFDKGLQSTKVHPSAYLELVVNERAIFIHNEKIGRLEFLSAYVPLRNYENKPLAYLNMPYFSRQSELKQELSTLIVALINVYVLLILFAIFATVVIANKITEPLKLVQQSLSDMELGNRNTIAYSSDDEIGSLVKEYNRKVRELAESAEKLAVSEREGAWREMAKQVAHEIKNPLTPMKLSVQLLLRAWNDQDVNFDRRINKTVATMAEQIDRLTDIATEFSHFAKMPRPKNQLFDIVNETRKVVELFEVSEKVEVSFQGATDEEAQIWADPEQLSRALINIIKNAVQAIPKDKYGQITVDIFVSELIVRIRIQDNGIGIPDELKPKIFWPNFTTKSSGTGVGLYIVQNIIKSAQGRIWFETELDKGTEFYIELPRHHGDPPTED
jgi:signal transduction histidine kinase